MSWQVKVLPETVHDTADAARWYETRQPGLGALFIEEVIRVWDALAENPLLNSRRHPKKNIHWRYPDRFPYRVVYEVNECLAGNSCFWKRQGTLKGWDGP